MSAKRTADPSDQLPAPPCLTAGELARVGEAVARKQQRVLDPEKVQISVRLGLIVSFLGFVIWATIGVTGFMRDVTEFQGKTTEALAENKGEIRAVAAKVEVLSGKVEILTIRQNAVIADRWRFSDQQPWAYQLERANRDVLREDGKKGLIVPEPIAKPAPQPP